MFIYFKHTHEHNKRKKFDPFVCVSACVYACTVKYALFKAGLHLRSKLKVVYTCDRHKHKVTYAGAVN